MTRTCAKRLWLAIEYKATPQSYTYCSLQSPNNVRDTLEGDVVPTVVLTRECISQFEHPRIGLVLALACAGDVPSEVDKRLLQLGVG